MCRNYQFPTVPNNGPITNSRTIFFFRYGTKTTDTRRRRAIRRKGHWTRICFHRCPMRSRRHLPRLHFPADHSECRFKCWFEMESLVQLPVTLHHRLTHLPLLQWHSAMAVGRILELQRDTWILADTFRMHRPRQPTCLMLGGKIQYWKLILKFLWSYQNVALMKILQFQDKVSNLKYD